MSLGGLDYPQALLAVLVVATTLGLGVAAGTSSADFGAYNLGWDGASDLRSAADEAGADPTVVRETNEYGDATPNETVAVVLSPDEAYGANDSTRLREFVEDGGTLVVAEDFGENGNALLAAVGADARVDGRPLRDERRYHRSPAFPVADNVSDTPLTADVGSLTPNHGSAVDPNGATVLATTSEYAYVDANRNGELDDAETMAPRPVATVESVGDGRVVTVGDPSLFINAMLERSGNRAFVGNLFGSAEAVLLDYSHAERLPPLAAALLAVRGSALLQVTLGTVGILAVIAWARRPSVAVSVPWRSDPDVSASPFRSADEVASAVRERHPEWDDTRIERVTEAVMRRRDEPVNDD